MIDRIDTQVSQNRCIYCTGNSDLFNKSSGNLFFWGGGEGGEGGAKSKKFFKCVITMHQQILLSIL